MSKNYNTRTASLKATIADIRNLDAKQIDAENINLKGKDILEYIDENVPDITYTKDTRTTTYPKDLWGEWVETKDDGTIVIHDDYLSNPNASSNTSWRWLESVRAVQNNKAYSGIDTDEDGHFTGVNEHTVIANIQTNRIKDGTKMFSGAQMVPFTFFSFSGDLSSLTNGTNMFYNSALESFSGDLSSLTNGFGMFSATLLTSFNGDMSSLTNGMGMFSDCSKLTSFNGDLSSLTGGYAMFSNSALESFSGDLRSLTTGTEMFYHTPLTSFNSNLGSLTNGTDMFNGTKLDAPSLANIIHTINTPATKSTITIGLGIDNTDEAKQALAEAIWCKDWAEVNLEFDRKNWTVTWQYNGAPTTEQN